MICPRLGSEMREVSSKRMQEKLVKWVESQYLHFSGNVDNLKCFISRFELNHDFFSESRTKIEYKKYIFTEILNIYVNLKYQDFNFYLFNMSLL